MIPVQVRSIGADREDYEFHTVARNLSASGIFAAAPQTVRLGEKLVFRIRFCHADTDPHHAPMAYAQGTVVRAEKQANGAFYFAALFTNTGVL